MRDIQLTLDNLANISKSYIWNNKKNSKFNTIFAYPDAGQLGGLEGKITKLEQEFASENIDEKINELRGARNRQALWLKNYEDELVELRAEVENIEEIRNSLPPDTICYRKIRLEP